MGGGCGGAAGGHGSDRQPPPAAPPPPYPTSSPDGVPISHRTLTGRSGPMGGLGLEELAAGFGEVREGGGGGGGEWGGVAELLEHTLTCLQPRRLGEREGCGASLEPGASSPPVGGGGGGVPESARTRTPRGRESAARVEPGLGPPPPHGHGSLPGVRVLNAGASER